MKNIFTDFKNIFSHSYLSKTKGEFVGVSEKDLKLFEENHKIKLPLEFCNLYRQTNGVKLDIHNTEYISFTCISDNGYSKHEYEHSFYSLIPLPEHSMRKNDNSIYSKVQLIYPQAPDSPYISVNEKQEKATQLSSLPFSQWSAEDQKNNRWWEGWYPEKKYQYLIISFTDGGGYLLMNITEENHGKIYFCDADVSDRYAPSFVSNSLYEFFSNLNIVYEED